MIWNLYCKPFVKSAYVVLNLWCTTTGRDTMMKTNRVKDGLRRTPHYEPGISWGRVVSRALRPFCPATSLLLDMSSNQMYSEGYQEV